MANWLERTGHDRGYVQIRWQRLTRDLQPDDGPQVEIIRLDELPRKLAFYEQAQMSELQWRARVAARQAAFAERMLG